MILKKYLFLFFCLLTLSAGAQTSVDTQCMAELEESCDGECQDLLDRFLGVSYVGGCGITQTWPDNDFGRFVAMVAILNGYNTPESTDKMSEGYIKLLSQSYYFNDKRGLGCFLKDKISSCLLGQPCPENAGAGCGETEETSPEEIARYLPFSILLQDTRSVKVRESFSGDSLQVAAIKTVLSASPSIDLGTLRSSFPDIEMTRHTDTAGIMALTDLLVGDTISSTQLKVRGFGENIEIISSAFYIVDSIGIENLRENSVERNFNYLTEPKIVEREVATPVQQSRDTCCNNLSTRSKTSLYFGPSYETLGSNLGVGSGEVERMGIQIGVVTRSWNEPQSMITTYGGAQVILANKNSIPCATSSCVNLTNPNAIEVRGQIFAGFEVGKMSNKKALIRPFGQVSADAFSSQRERQFFGIIEGLEVEGGIAVSPAKMPIQARIYFQRDILSKQNGWGAQVVSPLEFSRKEKEESSLQTPREQLAQVEQELAIAEEELRVVTERLGRSMLRWRVNGKERKRDKKKALVASLKEQRKALLDANPELQLSSSL